MTGKITFAGIKATLLLILLSGCSPTYSPDTYASNAVQVANKVDQGVIIGIRAVMISADATIGTTTLGAAGGIVGSEVGTGATSALGALGGTVAGGLVGNVVSHSNGDTTGFEYIVRKPNGDLMSVTQKDTEALRLGQHVLIIQGPQARIVPDYTVPIEDKTQTAEKSAAKSGLKTAAQTAATTKDKPADQTSASAPSAQSAPATASSGGAITSSDLPPPPPAEVEVDKKPAPVDTPPASGAPKADNKAGDDAVDTSHADTSHDGS